MCNTPMLMLTNGSFPTRYPTRSPTPWPSFFPTRRCCGMHAHAHTRARACLHGCTCMHSNTCAYTCIHRHLSISMPMHASATHACMCTIARMHVHMCARTCTCLCAHVHAHKRMHMHARACTNADMHTFSGVCMHAHAYACYDFTITRCLHIRTHAYTHACTHAGQAKTRQSSRHNFRPAHQQSGLSVCMRIPPAKDKGVVPSFALLRPTYLQRLPLCCQLPFIYSFIVAVHDFYDKCYKACRNGVLRTAVITNNEQTSFCVTAKTPGLNTLCAISRHEGNDQWQ